MAALDAAFASMIAEQEAAAKANPLPPLDVLPPEMVRVGYRTQRQGQDQTAPKDVTAKDLTVAGAIPARLYTPAGAATPSALLIYFHGGGFVIGDLESHDGHCRRLAAGAGCRVLAVDYRLAPEHPFPAGHDDALAATTWAFDHAGELGVDPARIAVGGCSAGGNLAASVALDLKDDPKRRLKFQLLLYPGIWPQEETASRKDLDGPVLTKEALAWFEKLLAAVGHPQAHRAMLAARDVAGAAPALVVTAGFDPLKDEGRGYAERLAAAGVAARHVEYPSLVHDFYVMCDVSPAAAAASAETAAALKAALQ
ncbi:alpha/beta hydrolase [Phenylobacterium sp.]|jgi:acetyl esterase|uniref:alpha/beta hydrolase n=1 Tax=Phenylobacterium sp. TaxID=1871053 RepID=UPI002F4189D0